MKNFVIAVGCVVAMAGTSVVAAGESTESGEKKGGEMACQAGACSGAKGKSGGDTSGKAGDTSKDGKAGDTSKDGKAGGGDKKGQNAKTAGGDNGCGQ